MNFQNLPPIESSKTLLDLAFRRARERSTAKKLTGKWLDIIKRKESTKIDSIKDTLVTKFLAILQSFPKEYDLSSFYVKLMNLTLDYPVYKKSLASVNWGSTRIRTFHRQYASKINKARDRQAITHLSKEYYGRISSILKQLDKHFHYLEKSRTIMRTYPDIKEMFTICIFGFQNVGKTTFLNKLTGSTAMTAPYPFTTTSINTGYTEINGHKIQVLDVPGTLGRAAKMNNIELQAKLVVDELAKVIIYVFDISGESAYTLEQQEELLHKISKDHLILIYLSKKDLLSQNQINRFPHKHFSLEEINKEIELLVEI